MAGLAWLGKKLYVAAHDKNFVAVYNGTTMELGLADDALSAVGYKPYGLKALGDLLYISYTNMSTRQGAGYIDVYDPCKCETLKRIINRDNLSIPYGMFWREELCVGNAGSGYISQFNDEKEYTTNVQNRSGGDVVIDGIMGITGSDGMFYYVASSDGGTIGSLGVMTFH